MPILSSCGPVVTPAMSRVTMNAVMLPRSSAPPVLAKTVKKSAMPPLVIQILLPFRTQSSPSLHGGGADRGRVRAASRARSGRRPRSSRRSRAWDSSAAPAPSVPNSKRPRMPIELCAPIVTADGGVVLGDLLQRARVGARCRSPGRRALRESPGRTGRTAAAPRRTRAGTRPCGPSGGSPSRAARTAARASDDTLQRLFLRSAEIAGKGSMMSSSIWPMHSERMKLAVFLSHGLLLADPAGQDTAVDRGRRRLWSRIIAAQA